MPGTKTYQRLGNTHVDQFIHCKVKGPIKMAVRA